MFIIGCDFHSRFQQIAMLDPTTGEVINRRLEHENGEAKKFYATLPSPGPSRHGSYLRCSVVRENACERIPSRTLDRRCGRDPCRHGAEAEDGPARCPAHSRLNAPHEPFPRIWVPSPAERDLRQMLRHRHKLVRFRTSVMNQLHALAMGQGLCRKKKLWGQGWPKGTGRSGPRSLG